MLCFSRKDNDSTIIVLPEKHEHDYRYLETVAPSCDNLGYERWQCDGCGNSYIINKIPVVPGFTVIEWETVQSYYKRTI